MFLIEQVDYNIMELSKNRKKQLASVLDQFYNNPVAKVSMELFLTIGLVIFLALFAIRPTLLTMSDLLKEIEDKKALDTQLSKKVAALNSAQALYLSVEERLPVLDAAIPSGPDTIYVLKIIEKSATDTGVVVRSISVTEVPETLSAIPSFEALSRTDLTMTVSLAGDYTSIKNFVSTLQSSQRTFVIDSVVFGTSESRGDKQLRASVTVHAPYYGMKINEKK